MQGVLFGDKHSYDDWGLVLTTKQIGLPEPKTSGVEVEGADGVLDTSEILTGEIKFNNRDISFEFVIMDKYEDYHDKVTLIANYLHGRKVKIILDEDNQHYYYGRCKINDWLSDRRIGRIVIVCDCEPYKCDIQPTVVRSTVNGSKTITLIGKRQTVNPMFIVNGSISLTIDGESIELTEGEHLFLDIFIFEGENRFTFTGNGAITISYVGGEL